MAHKMGGQKDGMAPLWGKAETDGVAQPGEEKGMGRSNGSLLVLKEGLQEMWGQTF